MTNKNKLVKSINNDFDKEENYNSIIKKIEGGCNKKSFVKYVVIQTFFVFVIAVFLFSNNDSRKTRSFENYSNENTTFIQNGGDVDIYDNIIVNEIDEISTNSYDLDYKVLHGVFIPYFEVLSNLKVPFDFDNKEDMREVWVKKNQDSKDYDVLNNYELHLRNTKNNREFIISFSDKYKIARCVNPFVSDYPKSIVNGVELPIVKGRNYYISSFSYSGYNFDIEGIDVTLEEFISLLESIIK